MGYSDGFWSDIKSAFERGVSTKKLSKINGVSRAAISTRAQKEGWTRPSAEEIERAVTNDTMSRLYGVKGQNPAEDARAIGDVADERVAVIRGHRAEWKSLERLRRLAIKSAVDESFVPDGWDSAVPFSNSARLKFSKEVASLYRTLVEALTAKQEAERRAHGFDHKMQLEAKRDLRQDRAELDEFVAKMNAVARQVAAPTPGVPRREEGGPFH